MNFHHRPKQSTAPWEVQSQQLHVQSVKVVHEIPIPRQIRNASERGPNVNFAI